MKKKIKGNCPICNSKMIWGSYGYINEPKSIEYLPLCANQNCVLNCGYGSNVKYRWINHRTIKIEGLWD